MELKDPTPAPPDNDVAGEKPKRHAHTTSGPGKKLWPLLITCKNRSFSGISINYRYDLDNERRFGRGQYGKIQSEIRSENIKLGCRGCLVKSYS